MKKYFILILLFMLCSISYSQIIDNYGLKLGLTYSKVDMSFKKVSFDPQIEYTTGLVLGFTGIKNINKNFSIATDLSFTQKGYSEKLLTSDVLGNTSETDYKSRFDYISLSLYPKIKFNFNSINPYLIIGPKLEYLINKSFENDYKEESKDIKNFQYGIIYGLGVELNNLIKFPLLIEAISQYDFNNYLENDYIESKNLSIEFKVGIIF